MPEEEMPREVRALRTNFLSLISHELRAPLQTVNGYLDLALSGMVGALNAEQAQFLKRARSGSIQLTAVVDDLLFLARAEGGLFRPATHKLALAHLVEEALEEVHLLAEEDEIAVNVTMPRALPSFTGDPQRLAQAVRNLLMEAIARTPEGGAVRVTAESSIAVPATRTADAHAAALTLRIAVAPHPAVENAPHTSDSALISPAHHSWLDEPVTAQRLRVCRLIAEAHGGSLTLTNEDTAAPTFALSLPLARHRS